MSGKAKPAKPTKSATDGGAPAKPPRPPVPQDRARYDIDAVLATKIQVS